MTSDSHISLLHRKVKRTNHYFTIIRSNIKCEALNVTFQMRITCKTISSYLLCDCLFDMTKLVSAGLQSEITLEWPCCNIAHHLQMFMTMEILDYIQMFTYQRINNNEICETYINHLNQVFPSIIASLNNRQVAKSEQIEKQTNQVKEF